ncbi:ribonuclease HIII [Streptococcus sp. zg-JUN1979]|uniref:ribonuclease HIII n=1 Tax=Streptococcus sp. zg-JUN1979 TaxID=3391450 RepID=UPI0039A72D8F
MNTIVMTANPALQERLMERLKASQITSNNPHILFCAKTDDTHISLYHSGKVVFQGKGAYQLAKSFGYKEDDTQPETISQDCALIGTDEVGNGSYFGGIAVVASFVTPSDHAFLRELGVGDSKTLSDKTILQIAPLLEAKIPHRSLLLTPKKYNEVVSKNKPYNAVSVKVALHNQAIFLLLKDGITADKIVIDAFTSPKNYHNYLKNEKNQFTEPVRLIEKAESQFLAVAVSSIIARKLFLDNLKDLSKETGYKLPSGASSASDKIASQLLKAYGMSALEHTAKLHFANTKKAQALLH